MLTSWWSNLGQEPSICPQDRGQNQVSDNEKIKENPNNKSKLTQKLFDENIWYANITKPIIFEFFIYSGDPL